MTTEPPLIKITKLDAAHRQLRTAITLWFTDGDPVSAHTLSFAAYEVLHVISKKRDQHRRGLIFDSDVIRNEHRSDFNIRVKKEAHFFKHADRDPDAELEFNPDLTMTFILYATVARELCGVPPSEEESAFLWWFQINESGLLTEEGRKLVADRFPVDVLESIRSVPKNKFLHIWNETKRLGTRIGIPRVRVV